MKTIEERAKACAMNVRLTAENEELKETLRLAVVLGYIKGATEQKAIDEDAIHAIVEEQVLKAIEKQKAIDIDKACEWLCEHIDDYARIGEDGAWVEHSVVRDFRKAMEEGTK